MKLESSHMRAVIIIIIPLPLLLFVTSRFKFLQILHYIGISSLNMHPGICTLRSYVQIRPICTPGAKFYAHLADAP